MPSKSEPSYAAVPVPKPRWSLRGLLIVVTVLTLVAGAVFAAPDPIALPVLVFALLATPTFLIVGITRKWLVGYVRAFSVGALLATALVLLFTVQGFWSAHYAPAEDPGLISWFKYNRDQVSVMIRSSGLLLLVALPVCGVVGMGLRWVRKLADVSLEKSRL